MTSIIKVNNLQNQCGANTINKCGTAITVGASGDTVTLAAGASQSGFGQTYSAVSWDTTPKTTTVTGVAGVGYFVNTSGGAITANLPAGTAGDVIAFADYTRTFQTNNLIITPNGSEKIGGVVASFYAQTEGQSITLVYIDATEGWINTMDSTGQAGLNPTFITATGGTITTVDTDYKVHTFTGPGTFTVCSVGNPIGSTTVDYMVIAGGGGGGGHVAGGGGAGGQRYVFPSPATGGLPVTATAYPITVGSGGPGYVGPLGQSGTPGNTSIFSTITSAGGGGGGGANIPGGCAGGSGGGGGHAPSPVGGGTAGAGNTPPVSPSQGNPGGTGTYNPYTGGGGGGANASGTNGIGNPTTAGPGGAGLQVNIDGNNYYWSGGGGGGTANSARSNPLTNGNGGIGGGGGAGTPTSDPAPTVGTGGGSAINSGSPGSGNNGGNGGTNSGGGAGGGSEGNGGGGNGGSGIVVIRYKFQ